MKRQSGLPACLLERRPQVANHAACAVRHCLSFSSLQAVLLRAGPQQMQGVDIRVSDTPTPGSGSICKAGENFDPSQGKIVLCQPPLQASFGGKNLLGCCRC